jgi:hypothetical protein
MRIAPTTKWHYTIGVHFENIIRDGEIKQSTDHVRYKPIVWFSTAPDWEPTANKNRVEKDGRIISLNREETEREHGGLVRIGVAPETAPHDWQALKELSGMSSKIAKGLYDAAIKEGSRPGDWWGTFEPVPKSKWIAVEVYQNGTWIAKETTRPTSPSC